MKFRAGCSRDSLQSESPDCCTLNYISQHLLLLRKNTPCRCERNNTGYITVRFLYRIWSQPQLRQLRQLRRLRQPACHQALPWLSRVILQINLHAFSEFLLACSDLVPSAVQNVSRLLSCICEKVMRYNQNIGESG